MSELWRESAVGLAGRIRSREVKPSEVMESVIGRVQVMNPELNAITVDFAEQAVEQAHRADEVAADPKAELGALFGVPITIKENIDMEGVSNPNGVAAFESIIGSEDAPLVRNVRHAGAIIIGRTNTPEFSMRGTTDNPLRGRTYNPWGRDASPGGSSGGAGSACAAGMGPLHHGNDIGGSLRFPSFANGVTTVKPTSFRIPVFNSSATSERGPLSAAMSVQGVIARHAADVALATSVMIRPDPRDPNCVPVPFDGPSIDGPKVVAVTRESHGYDIHPGILKLIDRACSQLGDAGYTVVEVDPPPVSEPAAEWFRTGTTEMKATIDDAIRTYGSDTINSIFDWYYERSEILDRDSYIANFGDRTRLMRDWNLFLDRYPLLLCPFLMRPTYDWDYDARGPEQINDLFDAAIYSTGINYLGLPAGVIGMDLVDERPGGVQIVGRRFREDLICQAMEEIETRNGVLAHRLWDDEPVEP